MKIKSFLIGALACLAVFSASASDSSYDLSFDALTQSYTADFVVFGNSVLDGGSDIFTFNLPTSANAGVYHVNAALAGFGVNVDWTASGILGKTGNSIMSGPGYGFGYITVNANGPFSILVKGIQQGTFHALGGHIDAVLVSPAVSAVPEPSNNAMFGAGLGLMGVIGMRRRKTK